MHALKWYMNGCSAFCFGDVGGGSASPPASAPSGGDGGGAVPSPAPAGESGGSTPAPSPAPDPGGTPTPPATPEAAPDPWAALGSFDDLDAVTPAVVPPKPVPEVPPVVPAAAAIPPPTAPPVPPVVPPAQAPAPTTQPPAGEAPPQALSPSDPVAIATAIEQNREAVIAHLSQTKFALSDEDVQELETDVVKAVPKIMSRVFIEAQMSMQKFLAQAMPGMMKSYSTVTKANDDAEKTFFDTHKDLDIKNAQHRSTAIRIATVYRKANPTIPLDQLIQEVGPMVRMALQMAPPAAPSAPSAAPAIPGQPKGGTPFRPAVNGGGGSSSAPAEVSEWAGMGGTYDE